MRATISDIAKITATVGENAIQHIQDYAWSAEKADDSADEIASYAERGTSPSLGEATLYTQLSKRAARRNGAPAAHQLAMPSAY